MKIKLQILDFWHAGSGAGRGAASDAEIVRTAAGLPFLPGRTLRGLLRESMQQAEDFGDVAAGATDRWFGTRSRGGDPARGDGALHVTDARLPDQYERWVATDGRSKALAATLVRDIAATAVDDATGTAKKQSLRMREAAIPMALTADVLGPEVDLKWQSDLRTALPYLRALGSYRRRGFGRVHVTEVTNA
jgi:hypothetical protein